MSNPNEFGDSIFIDHEHKSPRDQPVPMSLEVTEVTMTEQDEMVFYVISMFMFLEYISNFNFEPDQ